MNYTELYVVTKNVYEKYKKLVSPKELNDLHNQNDEHPTGRISPVSAGTDLSHECLEKKKKELSDNLRDTLCEYQIIEKKIKYNVRKRK